MNRSVATWMPSFSNVCDCCCRQTINAAQQRLYRLGFHPAAPEINQWQPRCTDPAHPAADNPLSPPTATVRVTVTVYRGFHSKLITRLHPTFQHQEGVFSSSSVSTSLSGTNSSLSTASQCIYTSFSSSSVSTSLRLSGTNSSSIFIPIIAELCCNYNYIHRILVSDVL
ncbi:hypothetical protein L1887_44472 [Cichorium endivia]|nr:hypothetical protein L1887_44472 [Cichorium endivia]